MGFWDTWFLAIGQIFSQGVWARTMAAINFVAPACTFLILNYLRHFAPTRSEYYYDTSPNVNNFIISASLTPLKLGSAIFVNDFCTTTTPPS